MKLFFCVFLLVFSFEARSQNEKLFTSQCIVKDVVGFDWNKSWWSPSIFKPGKIFMAIKIDHSESSFTGKDIYDTPIACNNISDFVLDLGFLENNDRTKQACYSIKEHGSTENLFHSASMCLERFDQKGKIKEVQCRQMRFAPDGFFIRLPWEDAMNLNPHPKNNHKDSLTISVGTCAIIN